MKALIQYNKAALFNVHLGLNFTTAVTAAESLFFLCKPNFLKHLGTIRHIES